MKYVLIGKIVNTHGLKGEVRILSSFKYKDKVFKNGMKVYIGKNKIEECITSPTFTIVQEYNNLPFLNHVIVRALILCIIKNYKKY